MIRPRGTSSGQDVPESIVFDDFVDDWLDDVVPRRPRKRPVKQIPCFSKFLLLLDLPANPACALMGDTYRARCSAFDLAATLGLLQGQPHAPLASYAEPVFFDSPRSPKGACGKISRHGLTFLISQHFQSAFELGQSDTKAGSLGQSSSFAVQTTIGLFTFTEGGSCVFFDPTASNDNSRPPTHNRGLHDIVRSARGKYLMNDSAKDRGFAWRHVPTESLVHTATSNFFKTPSAVVYLSSEAWNTWNALKLFSRALARTAFGLVSRALEQGEVLSIMELLKVGTRLRRSLAISGPSQKLLTCAYMCQQLVSKNAQEMDFDTFHTFARVGLMDLWGSHQSLRGQHVEPSMLFLTSQQRFIRLFRRHGSTNADKIDEASIEKALQGLLDVNPLNIALVAFQAFLGGFAYWNASNVLLNATEVPQAWLDFITTRESFIYIH